MAPFFNRWFLKPFSLCSKEQRNVCIHPMVRQWPALPSSHGHLGWFVGTAEAVWFGAQPSDSWGFSPMVAKRPDLHFPAQYPWPSPCASSSVHPSSRPIQQHWANWKLTLPKRKKRGGEDCTETNQPLAPQTLQPKGHKSQQRVRAAFWLEPSCRSA